MLKITGAPKAKYLFQNIDSPKTCYAITYIPFRKFNGGFKMSTISRLSKLQKYLNIF